MFLTRQSTGSSGAKGYLPDGLVVALAGNPNTGKSTVFNSLTGMKQHTGNWTGKTVAYARGRYRYRGLDYILVDLPGSYSLLASSVEEEVARDFICFEHPAVTVVVVDATCLERNLNLVLQIDVYKRQNLLQPELVAGIPAQGHFHGRFIIVFPADNITVPA